MYLCNIICTLPILLKLNDNMSSSVIIVTRLRAGLPDNTDSISGRRRSLDCTQECGPTAWPTSICSVGTVCVSPRGKTAELQSWPFLSSAKFKRGWSYVSIFSYNFMVYRGTTLLLMHKICASEMGEIFIRIILSSNGVSCRMIMLQILRTCSCYFHYITSRSSSWIWIVILKSVDNMELLAYCSYVYLLVWTRITYCCVY
jgi:hypothetical protein